MLMHNCFTLLKREKPSSAFKKFIGQILWLSLDVRGKPSKAAKVALIGTHADVAQCHRNAQGEYIAPQVHLLQVTQYF